MPIPKPNRDEDRSTFVSRCMSAISGEYSDRSQALAVCFRSFKDDRTKMKKVAMKRAKEGSGGEHHSHGSRNSHGRGGY